MTPIDSCNKLFWLEQLEDIVKNCQRCKLHKTRKQTVYSRGNPFAPMMLVGEAPGRDEDEQGKPFCGRAGQLLDKWLNEFHITDQVYIANILKCRPPDNRVPEADEVEQCIGYLKEQVDVVGPKVILLLGGTALKVIFGDEMRITRDRGIVRQFEGIPTIATFHPAFILRQASKENIEAVKSDFAQAIKLAAK